MKDINPNQKRYRELLKLKRRLLDKMKKHRKSLAKCLVQKKNFNEEITRLRKSGFAFHGLTPAQAGKRVSEEINNVVPGDLYPRDLERKFDKLEQSAEPKFRKGTVDITDLDDDDSIPVPSKGDGVFDIPGDEIIDFGGSDGEVGDNGPENYDE